VRKFLYVDRDSSLVTSGPEPPEQADGGREVGKRTGGVFSPFVPVSVFRPIWRFCIIPFVMPYRAGRWDGSMRTIHDARKKRCCVFLSAGSMGGKGQVPGGTDGYEKGVTGV